MSGSTLDITGEEAAITTLGHGTQALGPSDSSDTGSDVVGGPGMDEGLSDEQARRMPLRSRGTAGRDLGDPDLVADSDRAGTGERGSSGIDGVLAADTATTLHSTFEPDADDLDNLDAVEVERVDSDAKNPPRRGDGLDDVPVSDGAT